MREREREESRDDSPGASRRRPRAATTAPTGDEEEGWRKDEAGEHRETSLYGRSSLTANVFELPGRGRAPMIQGPR